MHTFKTELMVLKSVILEELQNTDLAESQEKIFKKIENFFSTHGFLSLYVMLLSKSNQFEQVYPKGVDGAESIFMDWPQKMISDESNPEEPFLIKKLTVNAVEETAVYIPVLVSRERLGAIILFSNQKNIDRWSNSFAEIGKSFGPLLFYMHKSMNAYFEYTLSLRRRLCMLELSERQACIVELLLSGGSNKDIAHAVHLSEQAIKYHIGNMLNKFNCKNRQELKTKIKELVV